MEKSFLLNLYEKMYLIREYEESLAKVYYEGKTPLFDISKGPVPGELHLSSGQESCAVGVCESLKKEDGVVATHRAHHFAIAKGVDMREMTAEIFGKRTGLCGGKGGHMHLFDPGVNFSCSGIVGASFPQAIGIGLAAKLEGKDYVGIAVGGEGAANQGTFHESLNLASVWKLPVIFVIEDNSWAISVPKEKATSISAISERAKAYGIPGVTVDGQDVLAVYEAAKEAIERARRGEGPSLLEVKVIRLRGHFEGDPQVYRAKEEMENTRNKDPIPYFEKYLREHNVSEDELGNIKEKCKDVVKEVVDYARNAPYPEDEDALKDVFVEV